MFNFVEIHNYQSLRNVRLELGKFTVITGETGSGKTALMRSFRAIASNVRGTAMISRGATSMTVTLESQNSKVTLHRTTTGRGDEYRLADLVHSTEEKFDKLNQGVPEEISLALGLDPVSSTQASINFANQFDRPYLLTETASQVARILGELTNVSTIFSAVQEGNRRRKTLGADVKSKNLELEHYISQAQEYKDLASDEFRVQEAESALKKASELQQEILLLHSNVTVINDADRILGRKLSVPPDLNAVYSIQKKLAVLVANVTLVLKATAILATPLQDIPDLGNLEQRQSAFLELQRATTKLKLALGGEIATESTIATCISKEIELNHLIHTLLLEAGQCPTCNQTITR